MTLWLSILFIASGCIPSPSHSEGSTAPKSPEPSASVLAEVVVTGQTDGAPVGCQPEEVTSQMVAMLDALNQGNPDVVADFFGSQAGASFQWYSIDEFVAYEPAELERYLTERHVQQEQLRLQKITFNSWEAERGVVHFGPLTLIRSADDLPAGEHLVGGKGAFHCATQKFVVLSLATVPPTDSESMILQELASYGLSWQAHCLPQTLTPLTAATPLPSSREAKALVLVESRNLPLLGHHHGLSVCVGEHCMRLGILPGSLHFDRASLFK